MSSDKVGSLPPAPAPTATPDTRRYWEGVEAGELWIQRCVESGRYFFYPRSTSPYVTGGDVEWVRASGRGKLYSYNILHKGIPAFKDRLPYALAVVELEEGPRLMANIVGVDNLPENLILDMPLQVEFERRGDSVLPVFSPAETAEGGAR